MARTRHCDMPPGYREEAENHPIAWFSALIRGVENRDNALIDAARYRLDRLGYSLNHWPGIGTSPRRATRRDGP